jgi:hypothetical protein
MAKALFKTEDSNNGRIIKTFFHELTHVKQLLMGDLVIKPRHILWQKKEKWDKREYSYTPWEGDARTFSDESYETFLRHEVTRLMADESIHAYHPSMRKLSRIFVPDDVLRVAQELHLKRDKNAGEDDKEKV